MYTFKIYRPVRKNVKTSLNSNVVPDRHSTANYYRKSLNCNCDSSSQQGEVIQVFKDSPSYCKSRKDMIRRTAIVNNQTVASGYNMDYNQYLKRKCATYAQRNVPVPNCCDSECATNNVYKRSNVAFQETSAVPASLQIASRKWEATNFNN